MEKNKKRNIKKKDYFQNWDEQQNIILIKIHFAQICCIIDCFYLFSFSPFLFHLIFFSIEKNQI